MEKAKHFINFRADEGFTANRLPSVRQVNITWNTKNEKDYTNFTLERSTDGGTS